MSFSCTQAHDGERHPRLCAAAQQVALQTPQPGAQLNAANKTEIIQSGSRFDEQGIAVVDLALSGSGSEAVQSVSLFYSSSL